MFLFVGQITLNRLIYRLHLIDPDGSSDSLTDRLPRLPTDRERRLRPTDEGESHGPLSAFRSADGPRASMAHSRGRAAVRVEMRPRSIRSDSGQTIPSDYHLSLEARVSHLFRTSNAL